MFRSTVNVEFASVSSQVNRNLDRHFAGQEN
jgi:hypothetical protein